MYLGKKKGGGGLPFCVFGEGEDVEQCCMRRLGYIAKLDAEVFVYRYASLNDGDTF